MPRLLSLAALVGILTLAHQTSSLEAGDWAQILGPNRNGIAENEKIADAWPRGGPKTVWQREVGNGFAGLAVAGGKAVLFHRIGAVERVEIMDAQTGRVLRQADYPARYMPLIVADDGPRCVPLIHDGRVYLYGAHGELHCLDVKTGKTLWSRDTFADYSSKRRTRGEPPEGYFGIGSTPIAEDGKLIVNVGGNTKGAGIVAFALDTGKTLWKATDERAGYSSPVAATVDGVRHVIFVTRLSVVSLDPATGSVRFRFPFGRTGPTVTAASPLVLDGHLFVSASYQVGAVFARIGKTAARPVWQSDDCLSSQYTTCIEHAGNLYGIHGRQDLGRASLRCFEPQTGKVLWTETGFGYATLLKADGKLLILETDGELVLASPSPDKYRELARATIFKGTPERKPTTRALPALANGHLYTRDTKTLKCIDLRKSR